MTNEKFFKKHYPKVSELYLEYLQTDEYINNPCVKSKDYCTELSVSELSESIMQKNILKAKDTLLEYGVINEWSGFILGFSYALDLIQEVM